MAKKVVSEEVKDTSKDTTKEKNKATKKTGQKKTKQPNVVVKKTKETVSELKKVTWPSFGTVVKTTGVVLAVVVIFTLVVFGLDRGFSFLYDLLVKAYSA